VILNLNYAAGVRQTPSGSNDDMEQIPDLSSKACADDKRLRTSAL